MVVRAGLAGLLVCSASAAAYQAAHLPAIRPAASHRAAPALAHSPLDRDWRRAHSPLHADWPRAPAAAAAVGALVLLNPLAAHAAGVADSAFVQASSLIFVSEIGDKTFFIATLLAARASKLLTFAGCAGALALMTIVSVAIGQVFHAVPPSLTKGLPLDDYVAIASFVYFGVKALLEAKDMDDGSSGIDDEREEAEKTLEEAGTEKKSGWPLVLEACTLTIVAEIGDRSQIATIALAAAANPFGVAGGAIFGHCVATGIAVLGGSFISKYLSERVISVIGGVLFLVFAVTTALGLF